MRSYIVEKMTEAQAVMTAMPADETLLGILERKVTVCIQCLNAGGKILFAGNGGSAVDAQHIAGEFVSRFAFD